MPSDSRTVDRYATRAAARSNGDTVPPDLRAADRQDEPCTIAQEDNARMYRRVPPLDWIRVFVAAARNQSFVVASEELSVTSGAVSARIKSLEEFLGVALFSRKPSRVDLTPAGRRFAELVAPAIMQIEGATAELLRRVNDQPVKLTVMPSFADLWLIPRLQAFHATHANISLELSADSAVLDLTVAGFDVGIRRGNGHYPGMEVYELMSECIFPVATPEFLAAHPLDDPAALLKVPIIRDVNWKSDWPQWAKAAGVPQPELARYLDFSTYAQAIDAALRGRGIVMAHDALVHEHLSDGRLRAPFQVRAKARSRYYAVTSESGSQDPTIRAFIDWLLSEAHAASQ
jgi:LysR family glycine cleavage system transcriptional activator